MLNMEAQEKLPFNNKVFKVATILTLLFAILDICFNITFILIHTGAVSFSLGLSSYLNIFGYFVIRYMIDAVFIWVMVYLVLDVLWIVSAIMMVGKVSGKTLNIGSSNVPKFLPWAIATGVIIFYEFFATLVFTVDLGYALYCYGDAYPSAVGAPAILPLFFSKGVFGWIALIVLLVMVIQRGRKLGN